MTVLSLTFKVLCSRLDNRLEAIEFLFELVAEIYGSALNKKKKRNIQIFETSMKDCELVILMSLVIVVLRSSTSIWRVFGPFQRMNR